MDNRKWALYVVVMILTMIALVKVKDRVRVDEEHDVICISRYGSLLGCMDTMGTQVSNVHNTH